MARLQAIEVDSTGSRRSRFPGCAPACRSARLDCEFDLADAREAAVDLLFGHEALDHVDPGVEGPIETVGNFLAEFGRHRAVVLGKAVVAHAAVAAGRRVPMVSASRGTTRAPLLGKRQRGREAGQAAADYRHVAAALHQSCSGTAERLRGVEPVGSELYGAFVSRLVTQAVPSSVITITLDMTTRLLGMKGLEQRAGRQLSPSGQCSRQELRFRARVAAGCGACTSSITAHRNPSMTKTAASNR